jgi:pimeloyl-ACP methyl ester carboxylesterase
MTPAIIVPSCAPCDYRAGFATLARDRNVITYPHGASDLQAVRNTLTRAHLIGHGCGGLVAAMHAVQRPEWVASLVVIDATPPAADLRAELARSRVPTLAFACGKPFGDMGAAMFDAMASAPRQLCVLPASGHFPWREVPDVFFRELLTFLREYDG